MIFALQTFLDAHKILAKDRVLVAASGGIDSTCLLHALLKMGFKPEVAHANFQLRAEASAQDEAFLSRLCAQYKLNFHSKRFDTKEFQSEQGLSTQSAARALRYAFFEELHDERNYRAIFTAHHQQDNIETFLIKLNRGSGLEGLAGIPPKRPPFYRPLLKVSKLEIERFAKENQISWREDASNKERLYLRNQIRHELLPKLKEILPDFEASWTKSLSLLQAQKESLDWLLEEKLKEVLVCQPQYQELPLDLAVPDPLKKELIYHWLKSRGSWDWDSVFKLSNSQTGAHCANEHFQLIRERKALRLVTCQERLPESIDLAVDQRILDHPIRLNLAVFKRDEIQLNGLESNAFIDFDQLNFPLQLRPWQAGDRFIPLGMKNYKKVSDFLTDIKLSHSERQGVYVLISGTEIAWVVGLRIDERFKLTSSTKSVYFVELLKN
jgi:tRNA(Ile)-lysidine synthase